MNYETQAVYNEPNPNKDGVIISPTTTESNVKNFPEGSIYIYHGNPPPFQYISNEHHTLEDLEEMARKRLKRDREKFRRSELSDGLKELEDTVKQSESRLSVGGGFFERPQIKQTKIDLLKHSCRLITELTTNLIQLRRQMGITAPVIDQTNQFQQQQYKIQQYQMQQMLMLQEQQQVQLMQQMMPHCGMFPMNNDALAQYPDGMVNAAYPMYPGVYAPVPWDMNAGNGMNPPSVSSHGNAYYNTNNAGQKNGYPAMQQFIPGMYPPNGMYDGSAYNLAMEEHVYPPVQLGGQNQKSANAACINVTGMINKSQNDTQTVQDRAWCLQKTLPMARNNDYYSEPVMIKTECANNSQNYAESNINNNEILKHDIQSSEKGETSVDHCDSESQTGSHLDE